MVEEIHSVRAAIAREPDNDLDLIFDAARIRQAAEGRHAAHRPPKKVPVTKKT